VDFFNRFSVIGSTAAALTGPESTIQMRAWIFNRALGRKANLPQIHADERRSADPQPKQDLQHRGTEEAEDWKETG
jgi:hypothetical protein